MDWQSNKVQYCCTFCGEEFSHTEVASVDELQNY